MSYGIDNIDVLQKAASYVDRILRGAKPVDLPVQAPTKYETVWIGGRLEHQRRHRRNDRGLDEAHVAVPRQIAHHFAPAGRVADMNGVLHVEMRRHGGKIVRIVIEVMAVGRLTGAAVAAAVVRDHAIPLLEEEQHLVVPVVG
jgi:hypothetical protein